MHRRRAASIRSGAPCPVKTLASSAVLHDNPEPMNVYAVAILTTLVLSHLLDLISSLLNLKALRGELPSEFEGVYDPEAYRKSQEYTRVRTRFGLVADTVELLVVVAFWFAGGFNWLDGRVRGWTESWGSGTVATGLVFIGTLLVARSLLGLPFSIYSTFVIEERFGFNKTTPKTFVADRLKGLVLGAVLGAPLLAVLLFFLESAGGYAWVYCWLVVTLFSLFLQFAFPTWIMPLFNKFEPLKEGDIRESILSYAKSVDFPIENVFTIDGSRRSSKSNAFFTGFGRHKRLALFDTLVANHTVAELVAVVAHEVGHFKKKHIMKTMVISIAHTGALFYLLSVFITHEGLFDAFYVEQPSLYAGLVFFGMLFAPIEFVLSIAVQALSRKNEYEADRFATTTVSDAEDMVRALKKLSVDNLVNLTPHPCFVFLHDSHPTMLSRIRAIRRVGA